MAEGLLKTQFQAIIEFLLLICLKYFKKAISKTLYLSDMTLANGLRFIASLPKKGNRKAHQLHTAERRS